eukprot:581207-Pyramimonas_sp.AAC.1
MAGNNTWVFANRKRKKTKHIPASTFDRSQVTPRQSRDPNGGTATQGWTRRAVVRTARTKATLW